MKLIDREDLLTIALIEFEIMLALIYTSLELSGFLSRLIFIIIGFSGILFYLTQSENI